jgi:hypothetical protein
VLYKNWQAICDLENPHFRLTIALSNDEEFLGKIAQVYPNLFTEVAPQQNGPFPLSYLREIVKRAMETPDDYSDGAATLSLVGFPHVFYEKDYSNKDGYPKEMSPSEVENTLLMPPGFFERVYPELVKVCNEQGYFPFHLHEVIMEGTRYFLGIALEEYSDVYLFPADLVYIDV